MHTYVHYAHAYTYACTMHAVCTGMSTPHAQLHVCKAPDIGSEETCPAGGCSNEAFGKGRSTAYLDRGTSGMILSNASLYTNANAMRYFDALFW